MGCQNSKVGIQFLGSLSQEQAKQEENQPLSAIKQIQVLENSDNLLALNESNQLIQFEMKSQQIIRVYNLDTLKNQQNQTKINQSSKFPQFQEQQGLPFDYNPLSGLENQQQNDQSQKINNNNKQFGASNFLKNQQQKQNKYSFQVSNDNKYIAVAQEQGGKDYSIQIYQFGYKFIELKNFTGHKKRVLQMEFSSDSTILATASDDQTVRIWAVRQFKNGSQRNQEYLSPYSSIKTPLKNNVFVKQNSNSLNSYEFNLANQKTTALISPQSRTKIQQIVPISEDGMADTRQQLSNNYSKVSKQGQQYFQSEQQQNQQNNQQKQLQQEENKDYQQNQDQQQINNGSILKQSKMNLQMNILNQGIQDNQNTQQGYLNVNKMQLDDIHSQRSEEDKDQVDAGFLEFQQRKKENEIKEKNQEQKQLNQVKNQGTKLSQRLKSHENMGNITGLNYDADKQLSMSASPQKHRGYSQKYGKKFNLTNNLNNIDNIDNDNQNDLENNQKKNNQYNKNAIKQDQNSQQKHYQSSKSIRQINSNNNNNINNNNINSNLNLNSNTSSQLSINNQKEEVLVIELGKRVKSMKLSNSGEFLVIGCSDASIRMWDIVKKQQIWSLKTPSNCNALDISQNDTKIVAACGKFVLLIDAMQGTVIYEKQRSVGAILSVKFSFKNEYIILAGRDQKILVLDSFDGEIMFKVYAHGKQINQIEIINKRQIASCSNDGYVKLWEVPTRIMGGQDGFRMAVSSGRKGKYGRISSQ
ncbi:WD40-repeat-containing domain [Pseudocohnilembus persalinus]|uniref:WD40-repeat-containing domain n=1 Tax=Pseudocohnilembus persalinus TaxID=266149 RepID=A0A0V0QW99_PSEPJ|nr:WD40-repeat-containing domain [Pseudocohnilembus persalinus]|eukprot:KRX06330.1 WD40-repeat-containing domain [Pseudocohnilembus persalinus]